MSHKVGTVDIIQKRITIAMAVTIPQMMANAIGNSHLPNSLVLLLVFVL